LRETPDPKLIQAFRNLLENPNVVENDIQQFLEEHTAFVETPHLLNHGLSLNSLITKFPIGPWKTDFVYLTKSTIAWRLVMVELEHPGKKLFNNSNRHDAFHSDLNNAIAQLDAWRDHWAISNKEIISRLEPLIVPPRMRGNTITPFYVLVIGRDREFINNGRRRKRLSALLEEKNLQILTYDSLLRTYEGARGRRKCILSPTATGFRIKCLDGEPSHMFAYVEPQHLEVSRAAEEKLVGWQYDIPSWRAGEPLVFNEKWTMRDAEKLDKTWDLQTRRK
jgi:hypothetical protein